MSSNNYSLPSGYYSSKIITQGRKEGGIRSKSMEDHQNYLPLSIENNKGIYKPKKEYYTGELFNNNNTKQLNYRSSSAERIGGITIVPIRREATLPARRFHSELRTRERNDDNYGYITKQQKTFGNNLYFDSTFDKRKYEERPQTNFDFWRDRYRMEAISEPNTNLTTSYTINYPNGNTTAAEYSSFQQNADNEGGIMKHFQHTKHQQNQREYREWHSGDKQQQQRRSAADSYTTMGTLRNSAEERQSRKAIEYNQKQVEGEHHRHYNGQNYLYYDSGNYKNKNKNEEKWQRNKSSERWYDGRKQREEYIDQRHYRKIRFCCFDIFWPPGGIKQTYYRPSPKQKINKSISQQPSPIPLEHRPFYTYNQSVHPSGHYQTDNNPIYREKGKEFIHNGRQLPTINYSESSREIPVNREHYYK